MKICPFTPVKPVRTINFNLLRSKIFVRSSGMRDEV